MLYAANKRKAVSVLKQHRPTNLSKFQVTKAVSPTWNPLAQ